MNTGIASLVVALLFVGPGCATLHHTSADGLQGKWTGREIGNAPETPRELIVAGKQIEYRGAISNDWGKGTFTIRNDTEPKQIIVSLAECGFPQYTGKTCYFIYKIEDGALTAAASEPGTPAAPLAFDAPHARRMVFKKQ